MTKDLAFICSLSVSNTIALAILSPTFHDYEDTFADCVVKAVFCLWRESDQTDNTQD